MVRSVEPGAGWGFRKPQRGQGHPPSPGGTAAYREVAVMGWGDEGWGEVSVRREEEGTWCVGRRGFGEGEGARVRVIFGEDLRKPA
jgi:hypothetical protein